MNTVPEFVKLHVMPRTRYTIQQVLDKYEKYGWWSAFEYTLDKLWGLYTSEMSKHRSKYATKAKRDGRRL